MPEKVSVRKTRRLRTLLARLYKLAEPPEPQESFLERIVMAVLWQDAPPARARQALVNLAEEFVDWNELRVSVTSEVAAILESCGLPGRKGAVLKRILGRAIEELFSLDFEQLCALPREKLRAWFVGIEGVPHRAAAYILYHVYEYDRVLVDTEIARLIRRLGLVSEDATPEEIEPALNVVIPAKEAHLIYNALWQHATTVCRKKDFDCKPCRLRKECQGGKRFIAEMEAAAKAAKEAAKAAKAAAKKKAEAKAKAARAAARKKAKEKAAKAKKSAAKAKRSAAKTKKAAAGKPKATAKSTTRRRKPKPTRSKTTKKATKKRTKR